MRGRQLKEKPMTRETCGSAFAAAALALAMGAPAGAQSLQEKLAAAKQNAAQNQQALRSYGWIEKVELSLKGEVKNTAVNSCRYGADGKVQKTAVVEPPPPEKKRGLRGKAIAKKTGEMKAELEEATALVHQYVPPDPGMMQVVMNAGTASLAQAGPGVLVLKFPGYVKPGDSLGLTFDSTVKALRQIDVATYLDTPESPVTLHVVLQALPDGPRYPGSVVLGMPARQIEVRITNSNYQKLAQ
jgi:hypothetical protein